MSDDKVQNDGAADSGKVRRRWLAAIGLVLLAVGLVFAMTYWIQRPVEVSRDFKEAKITSAYVDGEPFMRQQLPPGVFYRPIEVMKGTSIPMQCYAVKLQGASPRYIITAFGKTVEKDDCVVDLDVTNNVGDFSSIHIEYHEKSVGKVDTLDIPVVTVDLSERVEFHQLQDLNHQAVMPGGVPEKIYVYGRAIANLPGDSAEYGALFFVADPADDVPVVQMMPLHEGERPRPVVGKLVRYRSYGKNLFGYALWSPEPVSVNPVNRTVTDLYIAVFKMSEIDDVFKKLLDVEVTSEDTVTVTPLVSSPYDVMAMSINGRMMSESFHVVSGAKRVGIGATVPPPAPVPAPVPVPAPEPSPEPAPVK